MGSRVREWGQVGAAEGKVGVGNTVSQASPPDGSLRPFLGHTRPGVESRKTFGSLREHFF